MTLQTPDQGIRRVPPKLPFFIGSALEPLPLASACSPVLGLAPLSLRRQQHALHSCILGLSSAAPGLHHFSPAPSLPSTNPLPLPCHLTSLRWHRARGSLIAPVPSSRSPLFGEPGCRQLATSSGLRGGPVHGVGLSPSVFSTRPTPSRSRTPLSSRSLLFRGPGRRQLATSSGLRGGSAHGVGLSVRPLHPSISFSSPTPTPSPPCSLLVWLLTERPRRHSFHHTRGTGPGHTDST
ncbi:hypothetical protein FA13DRAFT_1824415, partial [Coprinellus micaceus]